MTPKNVLGMSTHPMLKWDVTNEFLPEPEVTYLDYDLFLSQIDREDRWRLIRWDPIPFEFCALVNPIDQKEDGR